MRFFVLALALLIAIPLVNAGGRQPAAVTVKNPSNGGCPPGLAMRSPACIPPGLAKKGYHRGGFLSPDDADWVLNPFDFDLPKLGKGEGYVQIGDTFVKANRKTFEILNLFDALGKVLD